MVFPNDLRSEPINLSNSFSDLHLIIIFFFCLSLPYCFNFLIISLKNMIYDNFKFFITGIKI